MMESWLWLVALLCVEGMSLDVDASYRDTREGEATRRRDDSPDESDGRQKAKDG